MKLVSRAPLAGAATCVQHQQLVSSQSIGGGDGVESWINKTRSCPPNDQLEAKACKTDLAFPIRVPAAGKTKFIKTRKVGKPRALTRWRNPQNQPAVIGLFLISPQNSYCCGASPVQKRAQRNFTAAASPGLTNTGGAYRTLTTLVSLYVK